MIVISYIELIYNIRVNQNQQTMKINFDELLKEQKLKPQKNNPQTNSYIPIILHNSQPYKQYSHTNKSTTNHISIKTQNFNQVKNDLLSGIIFAKKLQQPPQKIIQKIAKQSSIKTKTQIVYNNQKKHKEKETNKVRYNPQILSELARQKKQCNHKKCQMMVNRQYQKKIAEQHICKIQNHIPVINSQSKSTKIINPNQIPIYQKLHSIHKRKQFRYIDKLNRSQQTINEMAQTAKNTTIKKHLKNYTTFDERRQNQVKKRCLKDKLYNDKNQFMLNQGKTMPFIPNLSRSQRSFGLKSSILPENLKRSQDQDRKMVKQARKLYDTLNTSMQSLDKSIQIVQKLQYKLISRICTIFNKYGELKVTPNAISLLSQAQFNILFPFIQHFQDEEISIDEFEEELIKFYKSLTTFEKQQLRHNQNRIKNEQKTQKLIMQSKRNKYFPDYHKKIEQYI